MNSTVKSLVFWVALVVVGVVIYNLSTKFQKPEKSVGFSDFMVMVEGTEGSAGHHHGPGDHRHHHGPTSAFQTYAPLQYEGLGNELMSLGVQVDAKEATASPWASLFFSWAPMLLDHRLLVRLHAPDAERRQQGALVRQEQGEAVVELPEEGHVQGRRRR